MIVKIGNADDYIDLLVSVLANSKCEEDCCKFKVDFRDFLKEINGENSEDDDISLSDVVIGSKFVSLPRLIASFKDYVEKESEKKTDFPYGIVKITYGDDREHFKIVFKKTGEIPEILVEEGKEIFDTIEDARSVLKKLHSEFVVKEEFVD
jgi:hypothetical protein